MVVARAHLTAEARSWLGVPWVHQGRSRAGVDCVGLVLCVCWHFELTDFDYRRYSYINEPQQLFAECDRHMERIPFADAQPADAVVLSYPGVPHHMAFLADYAGGALSLIHAVNLWGRKVVEHRLDDSWRRRIRAAYRIPGVA